MGIEAGDVLHHPELHFSFLGNHVLIPRCRAAGIFWAFRGARSNFLQKIDASCCDPTTFKVSNFACTAGGVAANNAASNEDISPEGLLNVIS